MLGHRLNAEKFFKIEQDGAPHERMRERERNLRDEIQNHRPSKHSYDGYSRRNARPEVEYEEKLEMLIPRYLALSERFQATVDLEDPEMTKLNRGLMKSYESGRFLESMYAMGKMAVHSMSKSVDALHRYRRPSSSGQSYRYGRNLEIQTNSSLEVTKPVQENKVKLAEKTVEEPKIQKSIKNDPKMSSQERKPTQTTRVPPKKLNLGIGNPAYSKTGEIFSSQDNRMKPTPQERFANLYRDRKPSTVKQKMVSPTNLDYSESDAKLSEVSYTLVPDYQGGSSGLDMEALNDLSLSKSRFRDSDLMTNNTSGFGADYLKKELRKSKISDKDESSMAAIHLDSDFQAGSSGMILNKLKSNSQEDTCTSSDVFAKKKPQDLTEKTSPENQKSSKGKQSSPKKETGGWNNCVKLSPVKTKIDAIPKLDIQENLFEKKSSPTKKPPVPKQTISRRVSPEKVSPSKISPDLKMAGGTTPITGIRSISKQLTSSPPKPPELKKSSPTKPNTISPHKIKSQIESSSSPLKKIPVNDQTPTKKLPGNSLQSHLQQPSQNKISSIVHCEDDNQESKYIDKGKTSIYSNKKNESPPKSGLKTKTTNLVPSKIQENQENKPTIADQSSNEKPRDTSAKKLKVDIPSRDSSEKTKSSKPQPGLVNMDSIKQIKKDISARLSSNSVSSTKKSKPNSNLKADESFGSKRSEKSEGSSAQKCSSKDSNSIHQKSSSFQRSSRSNSSPHKARSRNSEENLSNDQSESSSNRKIRTMKEKLQNLKNSSPNLRSRRSSHDDMDLIKLTDKDQMIQILDLSCDEMLSPIIKSPSHFRDDDSDGRDSPSPKKGLLKGFKVFNSGLLFQSISNGKKEAIIQNIKEEKNDSNLKFKEKEDKIEIQEKKRPRSHSQKRKKMARSRRPSVGSQNSYSRSESQGSIKEATKKFTRYSQKRKKPRGHVGNKLGATTFVRQYLKTLKENLEVKQESTDRKLRDSYMEISKSRSRCSSIEGGSVWNGSSRGFSVFNPSYSRYFETNNSFVEVDLDKSDIRGSRVSKKSSKKSKGKVSLTNFSIKIEDDQNERESVSSGKKSKQDSVKRPIQNPKQKTTLKNEPASSPHKNHSKPLQKRLCRAN